MVLNNQCLGLIIGNSRLHWGYFTANTLIEIWHSKHLVKVVTPAIFLSDLLPSGVKKLVKNQTLPIYLASVVPSQTALWQSYPHLQQITLKDIPIKNLYSTMGIDRALAIYGAGKFYGYPCLVIDGGTALTFTGINQEETLVGGAILLGLRSQFKLLNQQTAQLPLIEDNSSLPHRWAMDTPNAIRSGIIHTVLAGIHSFMIDWLQQFPASKILITGGDGNDLAQYLQVQYPELTDKIVIDSDLIFRGLQFVVDCCPKGFLTLKGISEGVLKDTPSDKDTPGDNRFA